METIRGKNLKAVALEMYAGGWTAAWAPQFQIDYELTDEETEALAKELARIETGEGLLKTIKGRSVREVALEMCEGGWAAWQADQFQIDYELTDAEAEALARELAIIEAEDNE